MLDTGVENTGACYIGGKINCVFVKHGEGNLLERSWKVKKVISKTLVRVKKCFLERMRRKGFHGSATALTKAQRCQRHGKVRECQGLII